MFRLRLGALIRLRLGALFRLRLGALFRLRLGALWAALVFAAGFVLLRVLYRMVFGGVAGPGPALLDLPLLRLDGPFSHVTLLGPVTLTGLGQAAQSALPVAGVIVLFGVLNAVVDVRDLFARGAGRGPLRAVSRSLVIAWATFPALLESVRRVRVARALRGERGAAALLVPVFEQTIERALALAASMETRGLAAGTPPHGDPDHPVSMTDASLGFGGPWRLEGLTFTLTPGTLTVISGRTGSGKSNLLHSLSGLFQHFAEGDQAGLVQIAGIDRAATPPRDTAAFVGLVSQNVRLGFTAETVHGEIGFALAVRGVAPVIVRERVREVASLVGIDHLLARPIQALSAGEATLVAIAAALVARPILLLVDEPLADLDDASRLRVCAVLHDLAHGKQVCVVVAEHNTAEFAVITDTWLQIQGSRVVVRAGTDRPVEADWGDVVVAAVAGLDVAAHPNTAPESLDALIDIRHLTVSHGGTRVVDDVSLSMSHGEIVALRGRNGAGKSSVLHRIALPTGAGTVIVAGADVHAQSRRTRRQLVALVPENCDDLLFATTVSEECRRADRGRRAPTPTESIFAGLLGHSAGPQLSALLGQHPRDLSAGERLCLVIAIQLAAAPALLLVDEPTRGLDSRARALVGSALRHATRRGAAVLFATHDDEFAAKIATRTVLMRDARLFADPVPR